MGNPLNTSSAILKVVMIGMFMAMLVGGFAMFGMSNGVSKVYAARDTSARVNTELALEQQHNAQRAEHLPEIVAAEAAQEIAQRERETELLRAQTVRDAALIEAEAEAQARQDAYTQQLAYQQESQRIQDARNWSDLRSQLLLIGGISLIATFALILLRLGWAAAARLTPAPVYQPRIDRYLPLTESLPEPIATIRERQPNDSYRRQRISS